MEFRIPEFSEIQTLTSRINTIQSLPRNPMGARILVRGNTHAFAVKHIPGPAFNTVRGINDQDLDYLDEIFHFYKDHAISFRIEVTPQNSSESLFLRLSEKGFYQSGFHASFFRVADNIDSFSNPSSIVVRPLQKDEFDLFAAIYLEAFGLPSSIQDGIKQNNQVLFDVPGWEFYLALRHNVPIGIGVMYVEGELATLAAAATLPDYRNLGVQHALLHKRIEKAIEKGAKYITSEAAFGSVSHRNMERIGLKLAYTKAFWTKR
ncbi:GNAT family N-acetyltransferase [Psychrobacillus sp. FSL K6-2684]|uniref:GNAT family N-acetyltransferase n=1 Tax=Psychrobacillus sp. FSL K6-2684 TaxID=2921547 RepID=UPI0030FCFB81